ncbi:MAG: hypothetical protein ABR507_11925 [Actinomycetota bacterium]|nr:hypothetical protein [Actinomycetota bacterium]
MASASARYRSDFSNGVKLGSGFKYSFAPTGDYLDMRLIGYKKVNVERRDGSYVFEPSPNVKLLYQAGPQGVKETIALKDRIPTFQFSLKTSGLTATLVSGELILGSKKVPAEFRLDRPTAKAADGKDIGASLSYDERAQVVSIQLDQNDLAGAEVPITIDPTVIAGAANGATGEPSARVVFQTSEAKDIFFYREPTRLVYRTSSDLGRTWSDPTGFGSVGPTGIWQQLRMAPVAIGLRIPTAQATQCGSASGTSVTRAEHGLLDPNYRYRMEA